MATFARFVVLIKLDPIVTELKPVPLHEREAAVELPPTSSPAPQRVGV